MMIGAKVKYKFLCFVIFALFLKFDARTRSQDLFPFLISETGLKFIIWNLGEIHPGNRARGPFLEAPGNYRAR